MRSAKMRTLFLFLFACGTVHGIRIKHVGPFGQTVCANCPMTPPFDDYLHFNASGIAAITARASDTVAQLAVAYRIGDTAQAFAHPNAVSEYEGSWTPFVVSEADPITTVLVCDKRSSANDPVHGVQFCTRTKCSGFYGNAKDCDLHTITSLPSADLAKLPGLKSRDVKNALAPIVMPRGTHLQSLSGAAGGGYLWGIGLWWGSDCSTIKSIQAHWEFVRYEGGPQTYKFQTGVERKYGVSSSKTWGRSVASTAKVGFTFNALGLESGLAITNEVAASVTASSRDKFEVDTVVTRTMSFPAGVIWQWTWTVTDNCGVSTIRSDDLVVTKNRNVDFPCCPTGFAEDPNKQHGNCTFPALSICSFSGADGLFDLATTTMEEKATGGSARFPTPLQLAVAAAVSVLVPIGFVAAAILFIRSCAVRRRRGQTYSYSYHCDDNDGGMAGREEALLGP